MSRTKLLTFKEYVAMTEAFGTGLKGQSKRYWFNFKSKKLVQVTEKWHDWGPVSRPEAFGLKPTQVEKFQGAMKRGADIIQGVDTFMVKNGFIRCAAGHTEWSIRGQTIAQAGLCAKALSKKHTNPLNIYIDYNRGEDSTTVEPDQIEDFIKTGKIIQRTEIGSTMARFR